MILNNWVYYLIEQHNIPDHVIDNIFNQTKITALLRDKKKICSYNPYNKLFKEPEKIIELNNFVSNTHIIRDILVETGHPNKDSCQKYVEECVQIYKCMNEKYCSGNNKALMDNENTCSQLDNFRKNKVPKISVEDTNPAYTCWKMDKFRISQK
ncbi:hypothetical protein PVIIG_05522 [Plasmodium vivax India VII]|uniref:PIR Superfamily Protein n=1 Tax=Plasmodium vivax India VII TaxID=1077284 RepID=A0A0J9UUG5_PLAVI|nr:hypothetical protein PVIIG_05522 [Plasmodium vivax India VII]